MLLPLAPVVNWCGFSDPSTTDGAITFRIDGSVIQPLTEIGEVTARLLRLNAAERVIERRLLQR